MSQRYTIQTMCGIVIPDASEDEKNEWHECHEEECEHECYVWSYVVCPEAPPFEIVIEED